MFHYGHHIGNVEILQDLETEFGGSYLKDLDPTDLNINRN